MKKRLLSIFLAACFAAGLCGCGAGSDKSNAKTKAENDGKIVITVGGAPNKEANPDDYADLMDDIEEFNQIRPDVKVELGRNIHITNDDLKARFERVFDAMYEATKHPVINVNGNHDAPGTDFFNPNF